MTEKPADGVRGFFLYSPFTKRHFFRIYGETDANGRKEFTDYKVCAEDIEVTIEAGGLALYESEDGEKNRLDWSSEALGKNLVRGEMLTFACLEPACDQHLQLQSYDKPLTVSVKCKNGHRHRYEVKGTTLQPDQ